MSIIAKFLAVLCLIFIVLLYIFFNEDLSLKRSKIHYEDHELRNVIINDLRNLQELQGHTATQIQNYQFVTEQPIAHTRRRHRRNRTDPQANERNIILNDVIETINRYARAETIANDTELLRMINDIIIDEIFANGIDIAQTFGDQIFEFTAIFTPPDITNNMIERTIENRKEEAMEAENPVEAFIDNSYIHTSSSQNVHDTSVLDDIVRILNNIKGSYSSRNIDVISALKKIYNNPSPGSSPGFDVDIEKKRKIDMVLNTISENNYISKINMGDYDVLCIVYARIYNPKNHKNQTAMIENLCSNLADCVENGSVICATGRITRIISTLTLLDFDEKNWVINKTEDYKNTIRGMFKLAYEDIENNTSEFVNQEKIETIATQKERLKYVLDKIIATYSGADSGDEVFNENINPTNTILPAIAITGLKKEAEAVVELFD